MVNYITEYVMKKDKKKSEFFRRVEEYDSTSLYNYL